MINADVICCIGPPKCGTTWLYDNLVSDDNFGTFNNIKEINIWNEWVPYHNPEDVWMHEPQYTKEQYYSAVEQSDKPIVDSTLCYREALAYPDNVNNFTERFKVKFICILKDPVDILISHINFSKLYGLISNSKPGNAMQQLLDSRNKHKGLYDMFGMSKYSEWLPEWFYHDITFLDYDRLDDADYINNALDIDIDYAVTKSNVTPNKLLTRERMNSDLINVLENYYAKDKDLIDSLK